MNQSKPSRLSKKVLVPVCVALVTSFFAVSVQAIALSRGVQTIPISYADCLARAYNALRAVGYNASPSSGASFVAGFKGPHGVYITCGVNPSQQSEINVFVATEGTSDANVPGAERVRLQQQLAQATAMPPPVQPPMMGSGFAIASSAAVARQGQEIFLRWQVPAGQAQRDWIGIFRAGERNHIGQWHYTNGAATGSGMRFVAPAPGQYEFRYLINESYDDIRARIPLSVVN